MTATHKFGKPVAALALVGLVLQAVSWCCVPPAMAMPAAVTGEHCHSGAGTEPAHSPAQSVSPVSCEPSPGCCSGTLVMAAVPAPADSAVYTPQPAGLPPAAGDRLWPVGERESLSRVTRFDYQSPPHYLRYCTFLE